MKRYLVESEYGLVDSEGAILVIVVVTVVVSRNSVVSEEDCVTCMKSAVAHLKAGAQNGAQLTVLVSLKVSVRTYGLNLVLKTSASYVRQSNSTFRRWHLRFEMVYVGMDVVSVHVYTADTVLVTAV